MVIVKAEAQSSALTIADSLYATGNYTNAINFYAKVGTEKSGLQIARAYNTIGNYEKAILQYENLTMKAQKFQIAQFELGKLYLKTKHFDKARKEFEKLVDEDSENPEYQYYKGESFRKLEQTSSSLVAYKKAIAIDSTHLRSLFQLAKYYVVQQEPNQALDYLDIGLQFYQNDVSLINLKALSLFNNNQYSLALPFFEHLLELGERKPHIYGKLAHCYFKEWEFEKAKKMYHLLIKKDDEDPDPYFNLGHVFLKEKQTDSAIFYIKKSMEVQKPSFQREYRSLASIAREKGDLKSALGFYKLAHKENPADVLSFYQVCMLSDQVLTDPKAKLKKYESFIKKFGIDQRYFSDRVAKRISELKKEIHFSRN